MNPPPLPPDGALSRSATTPRGSVVALRAAPSLPTQHDETAVEVTRPSGTAPTPSARRKHELPPDAKEMVAQISGLTSKKVSKQFKLLNKIGSGSFGAVYEARHEPTGCIVALKCVQGDDKDVQREMNMQQRQNCPNIVCCYGQFVKDEQIWLIMELCAVGSVIDLMKVLNTTLSEPEIACVVRGALTALQYLHDCNGVHRDIKTDNILMTSDGTPKVGDFGVSRQFSAGETRMRTIAGTPYFIAPEILASEQPGYNNKADIWSVGISIIEMAEGQPPFFNEHPMRVLFYIPNKPPPTFADPSRWLTHRNHLTSIV